MTCPLCNKSTHVIKAGFRFTQKGHIQRYYCKSCKHYFTNQSMPYTQYPIHVILYTLQQYNLGYSIAQAKTRCGRKYRYSPPIQTIYSWIQRYKAQLSFLALRKYYKLDPQTIITTHHFNHQQIYPFKVHQLKMHRSAKTFPQLRRYLNWVVRSLPHSIFLSGPRASHISIPNTTKITKKQSNLTSQCNLALCSREKKKSPHQLVEDFFLANDATTVCTELPVFINPNETEHFELKSPLTGHIDIIQVKNNKLYILDYKTNLNSPHQYSTQLLAYKKALHHRTQIPEKNIIAAAFNNYCYIEYE